MSIQVNPLKFCGTKPGRVKTMRDIWDKGEKKTTTRPPHPPIGGADGPLKEVKGRKIFPPEIEKYYLEYLARKKAFLDTKDEIVNAFAEYEKKLGEAGFSKI